MRVTSRVAMLKAQIKFRCLWIAHGMEPGPFTMITLRNMKVTHRVVPVIGEVIT